MSLFFARLAVVGLSLFGVFGEAWAKSIDFDLSFSHSGTTPPKRPLSHIFVLDRSGSMNTTDAEIETADGKTKKVSRWEALRESLRVTLENTPNETEVRFIIVDGATRETSFLRFDRNIWGGGGTESIVMNDARRRPASIRKIIDDLGSPQKGLTPLYDILEIASIKAWEQLQEGRRVSLFVFSDGKNEGGNLGDEASLKTRLARKGVPVDLVKRISLLPIWVSTSIPPIKLFDTEWQVPGTVPMVATVESSPATGVIVESLADGSRQRVSLGFDFKVSDDIWAKIGKFTDELRVYDGKGSRVASSPVRLDSRTQHVTINIDDKYLPTDRDNVFQVQLACEFPANSYIFCDRPDPVRVTFAKAGEVSVAVVWPRPDSVVKGGENGEEITFEAMAKPVGSVCTWDFGDGTPRVKGTSVKHRYAKPGKYAYSVRAENKSLNPMSAKGGLSVVEASVKLLPPPPRTVVGEQIALRAEGKGPIARYAWKVNGVDVPGTDEKDGSSSELHWVPETSGKAAVEVRAIMKGELRPETASAALDVEAKPFLRLAAPKPGIEVELGGAVSLAALAENVQAVVFKVYGPGGDLVATQNGSAVKEKISEGELRIKNPGAYSVVAESADGAVKSAPVKFNVKAESLKVFIDLPTGGEQLKTGAAVKIAAHVTGSKVLRDACGGLLWEVNGAPIPNARGNINEKGEMSAMWTIPDELGRQECDLRVTILDKDGKKTGVNEGVSVFPVVEGAIKLDQPANNKHVAFDAPFALEASVSGRAGDVTWFAEVEGTVKKIGTGRKCEYRVRHTGQRQTVATFYASAALPGGGEVRTDEVKVFAECPPVKAALVQPQTNGITVAGIGLKEEYRVELKPAEGEKLAAVVWDMGDGTVISNLTSVVHAYTNYGARVIKVVGKCGKCEDEFSREASVSVEQKAISAEFAIRPSATSRRIVSGTVSQGRQVVLVGSDSPDIARREWTCNGQPILDKDGNPLVGAVVEYVCREPGEAVFRLTVYDVNGNSCGTAEHRLRVYRLWVAVLALLLALAVTGFFWYCYSGDDPRFWKICGYVDEDGAKSRESVEAEMLSFRGIARYWDTMRNKATIPLHLLGGVQSADWSSGTALGQAALVLWESNTAADDGRGVRAPNCSLLNPPEGMEKVAFSNGQLIRISAPSPSDSRHISVLWVKVKMRSNVPNAYLWLRIGIALFCLGVAFAACLLFAF